MKFAKILQSELVPEWKKAYIGYKELKYLITLIKRSLEEQQLSQQSQQQSNQQSRQEQERCENLNVDGSISTDFTEISIPIPEKQLSSLSSKSSNFINRFKSFSKKGKSPCSSSRKQSSLISYDTLWEQVNPQEKQFFKTLEEDLDKIEKFYEMKLRESLNRFDELVEQYKFMKESRIKKRLKENEAWPKKLSLIMQEIEHFPTSHRSKSVSFITQENGRFAETKYRIKHDLDYKSAKRLIKKALLEFYRGIILLKNYGILNKTGFIKILKKYDKVTNRNGSEIYLPRISNYNFTKSSTIDNLINETETFYINNFEQGARSRAMKKLRLPNPIKGLNTYYFVTWRVGLYIGLSIPMLARAIELAFRNKLSFNPIKWPILVQIYCAYLLPIVFGLLFGINMYTWTNARINYKFIFEFDPRHNLNYRQYFEIPAFMLLIFSFTTYIGFTFVEFEHFVWILGIILLSILICPLRIFYYDARKWFIIALLRVVASGFYRVEFRDFFIADELNSLTYTFMNSQFLFCAINVCKFSPLSPLLTSLPPWWRLVQCFKRYSLTYHKYPHLLNAGKYFSTIVVVWLLFLFRMYNNKITKSLWIGGQSISSTYSYLWDVLMDWSLLQLDSQNYLLRDELSFRNHAIYYFAIVSDGLLRFSWTLQLIIPSKYAIATGFVIAFGEMLRRWQWNFFRIENEHVNNCGQFRAIKEIPLPFERETTNDELNVSSEPQGIKLSSRITNAYLPQRRADQTDDIQGWRDFQPRSNAISYAYSDITDDEQSDNNSLDDRNSPLENTFPPLKYESNRNNNNGHYGSSGTSAIESDAEMSVQKLI